MAISPCNALLRHREQLQRQCSAEDLTASRSPATMMRNLDRSEDDAQKCKGGLASLHKQAWQAAQQLASTWCDERAGAAPTAAGNAANLRCIYYYVTTHTGPRRWGQVSWCSIVCGPSGCKVRTNRKFQAWGWLGNDHDPSDRPTGKESLSRCLSTFPPAVISPARL